ncbi:MAG: RsmD family RNA methyltransferase, partial [Anderseniella sp.]
LDPPYDKGLAERALTSLTTGSWLAENAVVVVEEAAKVVVALPDELTLLGDHRYGDTKVLTLQFRGADE